MENTNGKCSDDFLQSNIDATQLTVLFKAIGFRLEFFDFITNFKNNDNKKGLEIEIKCHRSGIKSKLTMDSINCCCPESNLNNNNSFWEVQAIAPNTPNKTNEITDSSSNLLPTLHPNSVKATKSDFNTVLSRLNNFIENNCVKPTAATSPNPVMSVSEVINRCAEIENNFMQINVISPTNPFCMHSMGADHREQYLTPLSSINITPCSSDQFVDPKVGVPKIILPQLNIKDSLEGDDKSNTDGVDTLSPFRMKDSLDGIVTPEELNARNAVQLNQANGGFLSPSASDIFPTSPNETQTMDQSSIVSIIKDAQLKLEAALNLLQHSNSTKNLSNCSTPFPSLDNKVALLAIASTTTTLSSTNRRHSLSVLPVDPVKASVARKSLTKLKALNVPPKRVIKPVMPQKNGTIILSKPIQPISNKLKPTAIKLNETRKDTPRPLLTLSGNAPPVTLAAAPRLKTSLAKVSSTGASLRQTNLTKVPSKSLPKLNDEKK